MWFQKQNVLQILELTMTKTSSSHGKLVKVGMVLAIIGASCVNYIKLFEYSTGLENILDLTKQIVIPTGRVRESFSWFVDIFGNTRITRISQNIFDRLCILAISNSSGYYNFAHFMFLSLGLSIKDAAKEFAIEMQEVKDNVEMGIQLYHDLKKRIFGLNQLFGTQLLLYFFTSTAYFVTGPDILKNNLESSMVEKYSFIVFFSIYILFWTISANFHASVQGTLKNWLDYQIFHKHHHDFEFKARSKADTSDGQIKMQLESMERELTAGCPSLAISSKYFAVTTGFLGTVCSVDKYKLHMNAKRDILRMDFLLNFADARSNSYL